MTDLTREQIGEWREMLVDPAPWASEAQRVRAINTLCDMALRSLAVPEGCVVVPMELTKEMLDAAAALPSFRLINDWLAEMQIARGRAVNWTTDDPPLKQAWRAMLSAAPPAAAGWKETVAALAGKDAHPHTDRCGFDRNGSHNAGHYVCMCGWEDTEHAATIAAARRGR